MRGERSPLCFLWMVFMDRQKRLFILNDDHVLNRVLKEFFKEYGMKVYSFEKEMDLDAEIKEKKPHAILLDVSFGAVSGVSHTGETGGVGAGTIGSIPGTTSNENEETGSRGGAGVNAS